MSNSGTQNRIGGAVAAGQFSLCTLVAADDAAFGNFVHEIRKPVFGLHVFKDDTLAAHCRLQTSVFLRQTGDGIRRRYGRRDFVFRNHLLKRTGRARLLLRTLPGLGVADERRFDDIVGRIVPRISPPPR